MKRVFIFILILLSTECIYPAMKKRRAFGMLKWERQFDRLKLKFGFESGTTVDDLLHLFPGCYLDSSGKRALTSDGKEIYEINPVLFLRVVFFSSMIINGNDSGSLEEGFKGLKNTKLFEESGKNGFRSKCSDFLSFLLTGYYIDIREMSKEDVSLKKIKMIVDKLFPKVDISFNDCILS